MATLHDPIRVGADGAAAAGVAAGEVRRNWAEWAAGLATAVVTAAA